MSNKLKGALCASLLTAALLFFYYSYEILHAGTTAYGLYGDGYKNYYTLAWYLSHDKGSHFTGMNYPYGENVIFTDNQPAVAWLLKPIAHLFPSFTNHIHGFVALVIFASMVLSAFIIFLILSEFGITAFHAIIFSTCITMLSPQLDRLHAHFSLGYTCVLPLLLLLMVKYFKTNGRPLYAVLLAVMLTFFSFVHIYYFAMSAFFMLGTVMMVALFYPRRLRSHLALMLQLAAAAITPFIALKGYLLLTDHVGDRPQSPYGYVDYRSTIYDIFSNQNSFTGEVLARILPPGKIVYHGEGMGYIGFPAIVLLAVATLFFIFSKRFRKILVTDLYPFHLFILPAIMVLMFAMAIPFGLKPFRPYYEHLPAVLRQFRAAGRFNWVFYYVVTLFSALVAYRFFIMLKARNKIAGWVFVIAVYTVWLIDINMMSVRYNRDFKGDGSAIDEQADAATFNAAMLNTGTPLSEFQAIIAFPFFLNGSEKIYLDGDVFPAMETSLITGLPLVNCSMSRTSVGQTLKIVDLLSGPLVAKKIISEYHNSKPLLLVTSGDNFSVTENKLMEKSRYLFHTGDRRYFELPLSAFSDTIRQAKEFIAAHRSTYFHHHGYESDDSIENAVVKHFEDEPNPLAVFGKGAHYNPKGLYWFYTDTLPHAADSAQYEVSFWAYADPRISGFPILCYSQTDTSKKEIANDAFNGKRSTCAYGNWVRVALTFTLYSAKNKIYICGQDDYATYDEFMIRPLRENIVSDSGTDSLYSLNNYPLY